MNMDFNNLPWHDACLQSIYIDRKNPGHSDVVKILILWPDNSSSSIEFYDCYAMTMNMNFGIIACESILMAECFENSEELNAIREQWSNAGVDISKLRYFKITTNSTNSVVNIFSCGFRLIE